jgi:hypothetical protein
MGRLLLVFTAGIPTNNGVEPLESVAAGSEVAEDLMLAVEIEGAAGLRWFGWLVWVGFEVGRREPESKFAAAIARPAVTPRMEVGELTLVTPRIYYSLNPSKELFHR